MNYPAVNLDGTPAFHVIRPGDPPPLSRIEDAPSSIANYPSVADARARQERYRRETGHAGHLYPTITAPYAGKGMRVYNEHILAAMTPEEYDRLEATLETKNWWSQARFDFDPRQPEFTLRCPYPTMPLPPRSQLWSRHPTPYEQAVFE